LKNAKKDFVTNKEKQETADYGVLVVTTFNLLKLAT